MDNIRMVHNYLLFLLSLSPVLSVKTPPGEDFYHAAVVEYCPLKGDNSYDSLMKNAKEYSSLIAEASKKADIVVFPEEGLFFFDKDYTIYIEVPFGSHVNTLQNDKNVHPVLLLLSQAAQNNSIYVVINLREKYISGSETFYYNANVVFNRSGNIIARYRKTHLFNEPLNITKTPEHVYFDSDFGVRFGTFICFDMLFKEPTLEIIEQNNITDIVYPTLWFSGLPFFTAVQTQAGWAYAADVNLLAACGNSVLNANTGSGIYAGKKGPVVYLQSQRNETAILYSKVIKKGRKGTPTGEISTPKIKGQTEKLKIWGDTIIPHIESSLLTPNINITSLEEDKAHSSDGAATVSEEYTRKLCHNGFCCTFNISATFIYKLASKASKLISNPYRYRLAVFNGIQSYYVTNVGVQFCAIISCLNDDISSCGKPLEQSNFLIDPSLPSKVFYLDSTVFNNVTIKTSSLENDSFTFPDILELSEDPDIFGSLMNPSKFSFSLIDNSGEINFMSDKLVTAALYTRVFSRDDPLPSPSRSFLSYSIPIILIILTTLYYAF